MTVAADLIRPLVWNQQRLDQLLKRRPSPAIGRLIVETSAALYRAEKIARELTPFDPTGL